MQWSLHYEDVVDPKAKAAPTEEDLRAAYLEGVANLVTKQNDVVTYTLAVGQAPVMEGSPAEGEAASDPADDADVCRWLGLGLGSRVRVRVKIRVQVEG